LITALVVFGGARASEPGSAPLLHPTPYLASPYQQYELSLRAFYPVPSRAAGVLLETRINGGKPLRLVLDSGAESIVIGAKSARSAGLSMESELDLIGVGKRRARKARAERIEIGPVSFGNYPVTFVDGTVVEGADGVIPLSMFSDFLLRLNLPGKKLILIPYPSGQGRETTPLSEITKHHLLLVKTTVNGTQQGYLVLDTGASCSAVSRQAGRTLFSSHNVSEVPLATGTGVATGQLISSDVHFVIADQDVNPKEVVSVDLAILNYHYGVELVGVLGYPALMNYVLTVDYRHERVDMETSQGNSAPDRHRDHEANVPATLAFH